MAAANVGEANRNEMVNTIRGKGRRGFQTPGDGDAGFFVDMTGINARNDAQTDLVIPSNLANITIYAPTHIPSQYSCVEATTMHRTGSGGGSTVHHHGYWDWCNGEYFRVLEQMSSTWRGKYTRLYAGYGAGTAEPSFYVIVQSETPSNPVGGCWQGLLYNFNTGVWEQKIRSCGNSALVARNHLHGWTMWESYGLSPVPTCPTLPQIKAAFLRKQNTSGGWDNFVSSDLTSFGYGYCFAQGIYSIVSPVPGEWQGHTPN